LIHKSINGIKDAASFTSVVQDNGWLGKFPPPPGQTTPPSSMKPAKWMFASLVAFGLSLVGAQAATYMIDSVGAPIFVPAGGSTGAVWNITQLGYDSGSEAVSSAQASFSLTDLAPPNGDGGNETAVITLDGGFFGIAQDFLSATIGGNIPVTLAADGTINWLVSETSGASGFVLTDAAVTIVTVPRTNGVPDGGSTLPLLGGAFTTLGLLYRRWLSR
jgi:hypothetical protein